MKGKFKQRWSPIPIITPFHLSWTEFTEHEKTRHIPWEIQVLPWDRKTNMEGLKRPLRTSEPFLIITESTTEIHIFTSEHRVKPSKHLVASFSWHRSCHMNYFSYIKDILLAEASYSHEIVLKTIVISNKEILINLEPKSNWHYTFQ
jgi:hypothetical protein